MITTEYVADGMVNIYVHARIDTRIAKEVAWQVFRSFHLGVRTFFLHVTHTTPIDQDGLADLALIGQGIHNQGGIWNIVGPHSSVWDQLLVRISLQQLPPGSLN